MKKALVMVVLLLLAATTAECAYTWQHVESPGLGQMAVDPNGNLWLATSTSLYRWTGGGWGFDSTYASGSARPSLAFSVDGRPHIISTRREGPLYYYSKDESGWKSELVADKFGHTGGTYDGTIAIGLDGRVHTAYASGDSGCLYLASRNIDGTWEQNLIDDSYEWVGMTPEVAVDSTNGNTVLTYSTGRDYDLKMLVGQPGNWTSRMLTPGDECAWDPELIVMPNGQKRIAYYDVYYQKFVLLAEQSYNGQPNGVFKKATMQTYNPWFYSMSMTLGSDSAPLMMCTIRQTEPNPATSKIYGFWFKDNLDVELFQVDGGKFLSHTDYINGVDPYITCQVVGGQLFVNAMNQDGMSVQTWYAAVPEPSSILALVTGLAGIGTLRRRRS